MVAEGVQHLLHLERRRDGLDEHRGPDRPGREAEHLLGVVEDELPEPRLVVALHLRQVEVRPAATVELLLRVVEQVEPGVDQGTDGGGAVDQEMPLGQVPAARAGHDRRQLAVLPQAVLLAVGAGEGQRPPDGVVQDHLPADDVAPVRGIGVLEVGQPDAGAAVERVDRHLRLGRSGDLHPAVDQPRWRRRHVPRARPDVRRLRAEVDPARGGDLGPAGGPRGHQRVALGAEAGLQIRDEVQGGRRQDLLAPLDRRALHAHVRHCGPPRPGRDLHSGPSVGPDGGP